MTTFLTSNPRHAVLRDATIQKGVDRLRHNRWQKPEGYQGASCFGPAYEFSFIMDTDLRRKRRRRKIPMTFVTSEPYIGHLGLGGVGDSKGLLEHEFRQRDIRWHTNAKIKKIEQDKMTLEMVNEGEKEIPFGYAMISPAFKGVDAVAQVEGLCNPRGFVRSGSWSSSLSAEEPPHLINRMYNLHLRE